MAQSITSSGIATMSDGTSYTTTISNATVGTFSNANMGSSGTWVMLISNDGFTAIDIGTSGSSNKAFIRVN